MNFKRFCDSSSTHKSTFFRHIGWFKYVRSLQKEGFALSEAPLPWYNRIPTHKSAFYHHILLERCHFEGTLCRIVYQQCRIVGTQCFIEGTLYSIEGTQYGYEYLQCGIEDKQNGTPITFII